MKKRIDYILLGVSVLLGILTLILMVAPGVTLYDKQPNSVYYSVYYVMFNFGKNLKNALGGLVVAFAFTIAALAVSLFLCLLKLLGKKINIAPMISFVATALTVTAGILFFCTRAMVFNSYKNMVLSADYYYYYKLGAGAILCGVFSVLNAATLCLYGFTFFNKRSESLEVPVHL
ncbi:MAG: hypothetical protein IJU84_02690 [Clostridia bacterium]|nr:hypothetical protein [Clostridia bacterium]